MGYSFIHRTRHSFLFLQVLQKYKALAILHSAKKRSHHTHLHSCIWFIALATSHNTYKHSQHRRNIQQPQKWIHLLFPLLPISPLPLLLPVLSLPSGPALSPLTLAFPTTTWARTTVPAIAMAVLAALARSIVSPVNSVTTVTAIVLSR